MATFKFVLRPSTKAGKHPGSLFVRVIHNRKSKTAGVRCRLFPEEWNVAEQTIVYPEDNTTRTTYLKEVDERIAASREKMTTIIRKLERKAPYTANDLIARFVSERDENKLIGYAGMLADELKEKGQVRTARAYVSVCRHLVDFNNGTDIPLEGLNATLIRNFESHLKEKGNHPNTISYYMRNLRAIYNKAVNSGCISRGEIVFAGVFTGVKETRKRALTTGEVNRLMNLDLNTPLQDHLPDTPKRCYYENLDRSRLFFFFCLYAQGMCFVDMCYLKKTHLRGNIIRYYRKKTGKQIEVPVNEGMKRIIEEFKEETANSEYLFPLLWANKGNYRTQYESALRSQNRRLKKLTALADIDKCLATHVARHSWASILKNKMQPLSVISEGLGHSSEMMTRKYLASFDHSILDGVGKTLISAISNISEFNSALL